MAELYKRPGWFTRYIFNPAVAGLTRLGVSVLGSRVLEVTGRRSGQPRRTPVNLLTLDGTQYLVAPRGVTEWVRNVRAGGGKLALLRGRHRDERVATELEDSEKVPVLRAYLKRWKAEVGVFFEGVGPDSTDEQLAAIAPRHPVFRLN
jgi:deazaflavin-dependent oxidoreductase (nitroreductase family)